METPSIAGPTDSSRVPRFAGPATFARLPRRDEVGRVDVAVVGVPFDSGVSYRPGARFGPSAIREASRLLRPYHPGLDVAPFAVLQVADCGDIACNPFDIGEAIASIEAGAGALMDGGARLVTLGGDHTIALPLLRAAAQRHGPVALIHFDAHLDTWDTYFGVSSLRTSLTDLCLGTSLTPDVLWAGAHGRNGGWDGCADGGGVGAGGR